MFALTVLFLFLIMLMRYFSVAGLFYLLVWKRPLRWRKRELNSDKPSRAAITREILWSISATLIFAVPGAFMLEGWKLGWTWIYLEPARYGWSYFVLGPLLYMALHDTYFYWTHRLLHQRWWSRHAHYVHHQSLSPSPQPASSPSANRPAGTSSSRCCLMLRATNGWSYSACCWMLPWGSSGRFPSWRRELSRIY